MSETETTKKKRTVIRLKAVSEMSAEELAAYNRKSELGKADYQARLRVQEAHDTLKATRETQGRERKLKTFERETVKAIREKKLTLEEAVTKVTGIMQGKLEGIPVGTFKEEEARAMAARIKAESEKTTAPRAARASGPVVPAFKLTHGMLNITKRQLIPPTDGMRPDAALTTSLGIYGIVQPLLVTTDFTTPQGDAAYYILSGKRRYALLPEAKEGEAAPTFPVVLVTGFPDRGTMEEAALALDRVQSLNVMFAAQVIEGAKKRGRNDSDIRRVLGMKTGEVEKYTRLLTGIPEVIRQAFAEGRIAPATLLNVSKLSESAKDKIATAYQERLAANAETARISETDVDNAKSAASQAVINRDAAMLNGAAQATPSGPSSPATPAQDGAAASGQPEAVNAAPSPATASEQPAPASGLDKTGDAATMQPAQSGAAPAAGTEWVEPALDALGSTLGTLPTDLPEGVYEAYRTLREAIGTAAGEDISEYAAYPDDTPPETYKAKKGVIDNTVANRPGWKPTAVKSFTALMGAIHVDAGTGVWDAFNKFKSAVSNAKTGE